MNMSERWLSGSRNAAALWPAIGSLATGSLTLQRRASGWLAIGRRALRRLALGRVALGRRARGSWLMGRLAIASLALATTAVTCAQEAPAGAPAASREAGDETTRAAVGSGTLVIAGGGKLGDEIRQRALAAAGGPEARVVVIPQASGLADTGERSRQVWIDAGARDVSVLELEPAELRSKALERATLIWITGGDQNRLMQAIGQTEIPQKIRERFEAGAVIAGTSAGAAVMAEHMFTGKADLESVSVGATETTPGLGLLPALIDQHFHARRRFNRLISAVLDRPQQLGIGIDESTAIVVRGGEFEVIGRSSVLVIDARQACVVGPDAEGDRTTTPDARRADSGESGGTPEANERRTDKPDVPAPDVDTHGADARATATPAAGAGIRVHILRAGMRFALKPDAPSRPEFR